MLSQQEVERIHQATLDVLSKTGIYFWNSPAAVKILGDAGCKVKGKRVFYPPELVEKTLKLLPNRNNLRLYSRDGKTSVGLKQGETHFMTIGSPYYVFDFDTGRQRDVVEADVERVGVFFDSLDNFEIGVDQGIGDPVTHNARMKGEKQPPGYETADGAIAFFRSRVGIATKKVILVCTGRSREDVRLGILAHLIFRDSLEDLRQRPLDTTWVNPVSPLQYDEQTEGMLEGVRWGIPTMFSPEVMIGTTGPVTLAGSLVQQNAEVIAGIVLAQFLNPGIMTIYGTVSASVDLRVADISMGSIETAMFDAACVQMADFYGLPTRVSPGNSGTNRVGARAAVEAAIGAYIAAGAGGSLISTGLIDSTLMLSYEHLIVMNEIIGQVKRFVKGIKVDEERIALDLIHKEGHPKPDYLRSEHTLKFMKEELYLSGFCGRIESSYEDWYKKANKKVKEIMKKPPLSWNEEIKERIEVVAERIRKDNKTWKEEKKEWWRYYIQDFIT